MSLKKSALIASAAAFISILSGCSSTKVSMHDYAPVALASVFCNASVTWYTEENGTDTSTQGGMLNGLISRADSSNPEVITAQERIDSAAEAVLKGLKNSGLSVIDPSAVQQSRTVKAYNDSASNLLSDLMTAEGYKHIKYTSTGRNRNIATETGAKSLLFVEFVFQREKISTGPFTKNVVARVKMNVYATDAGGHKILKNSYVAKSSTVTPYDNGSWDKEAICNAFPEAVESAVNLFLLDYGSKIEEDSSYSTEDVAPTSIAIPKSMQAE